MAGDIELGLTIGVADQFRKVVGEMRDDLAEGAQKGAEKGGNLATEALRKSLTGELVGETIGRLGQRFDGLAKQGIDAAATVTRAFFQAGPAGAALAGFGVVVGAVAEAFNAKGRAAQQAAEVAAKAIDAERAKLDSVREKLREVQRDERVLAVMRASGLSEAQARAQVELESITIDRNKLRTRLEYLRAEKIGEQEKRDAAWSAAQALEAQAKARGSIGLDKQGQADLRAAKEALQAATARTTAIEAEQAQLAALNEAQRLNTQIEVASLAAKNQGTRASIDRAKALAAEAKALEQRAQQEATAAAQRALAEDREFSEAVERAADGAQRRAQEEVREAQQAHDRKMAQAARFAKELADKESEEAKRARDTQRATADFVRSQAQWMVDGLASSLGQAVSEWALYSRAQEEAAKASQISAAEAQANADAQTQATLAGIAAQAVPKAAFAAAEGTAAVATGLFTGAPNAWGAGTQFFAAAAMYAALGGGAAIGARAIGEGRGTTTQEREQREGRTGTGSLPTPGGAPGRGPGSITVIVNSGGGVLSTDAAVAKAAERAIRRAGELR